MNDITGTPKRARLARTAGFIAWGALLVLQVAWHGPWSARTGETWLGPLLLATLPLLLPGLAWRRPARALLLAAMVALFLFSHGVAEAWGNTASRAMAWAEILLALTLVLAAGFGSMQRRR